MKKRKLYILFAAALLLGGTAIFLHNYQSNWDENAVPLEFRRSISEQEMHQAAAKWNRLNQTTSSTITSPPLDLKQPVRLAIGSLGMANDAHNRSLGDLVLADLSDENGFDPIERQSLESVLRELDLGLSGLVRANDAVQAGKLLKADWFLLGSEATIMGTNSIIVRLVDARTGILQDAAAFPVNDSLDQLSASIAKFVRQSRQKAAAATPHVYLAIGAFEDLSVNNRQAGFPTQLRGYLVSALQGASITFLEREYVDALLQEMELDLAGLTEESTGNAQPMQSAFWLVTGRYQSYENDGLEVEVLLKIQRIFGRRPKQVILRGAPENAFFQQIAEAVEEQIRNSGPLLAPSRRTEARNQIDIGRDLFTEFGRINDGSINSFQFPDKLLFLEANDHRLRGEEAVRRRQNISEALRAFQTATILDPADREARICIAACLQNPLMGRKEESREYYRQILEGSADDKWAAIAKQNLRHSFYGEGPWGEHPWYARAAAQSANPSTREYFQQIADETAKSINYSQTNAARQPLAQVAAANDLERAKANLLKDIQAWKEGTGHRGLFAIMESFVRASGTNNLVAAQALVDFLPDMQAKFPEFQPHLQGAVVGVQVNTNSPVIADFLQTLDWCEEHPHQLNKAADFWTDLNKALLNWCYSHNSYPLAAKIIAHEQRTRAPDANYLDDERLVLAMECFEHEQWQDALDIFQCYSNRPVILKTGPKLIRGRWANRSGLILTGKYTALCRVKLGLPHVNDSREFEMAKPCLDLDAKAAFAVDSASLWVAQDTELRLLDFDLNIIQRIPLPVDREVLFTSISCGASNIWVGTEGSGLIQVNRANKNCKQLVVHDGLLMNSVSQLHSTDTKLWIGYGQGRDGGVGVLDLSTGKLRSYSPEFSKDGYERTLAVDPTNGPPRSPVTAISTLPSGDLLALVSGKGLQQFSVASNHWEMTPNPNGYGISSVAANNKYWVRGVSIGQVQLEIKSKSRRGQISDPAIQTNVVVSQEHLAARLAAARADTNVWATPTYGVIAAKGGLEIYDLQKGQWKLLQDADGLPHPPDTLAWDKEDLWVGGEGYIALVNVERGTVLKFCYVPSKTAKSIYVAGGHVWALLNGRLHRMPLNTLR